MKKFILREKEYHSIMCHRNFTKMGFNKECIHPSLKCIGGICFSSSNDLGGGLKASANKVPKKFYRIQSCRGNGPFLSLQTITFKIVLSNHCSVRSCIITHQNETGIHSIGIWLGIWIKNLIPISYTSQSSFMEHMQVSVTTEWDPCLNHDSTHHFCTCVFQQCRIGRGSGVLFPSDQQTSWIALYCESRLVCEEYRSALLSGPGKFVFFFNMSGLFLVIRRRGHTHLVALHRDLHSEG